MSRVVVPTRYAGQTLGFLWFLDDEGTMTGDRGVAGERRR